MGTILTSSISNSRYDVVVMSGWRPFGKVISGDD
jgi:hypothetical protein